ncbi:MAG: rod shape-determining protein MreC [Saprospiraceae bacterium]
MRQIVAIFTRSGGILVFLILEVICLSLVVTFNKDQREIYHNSRSIMSDSVTHGWGEITQYWNLSAVNDSLAGVIAELKQQQDEAKFLKTIKQDSAKFSNEDYEQQYTYTAAKVVANTINLPNNFLTLDRGIRDGINTRMGVFDNRGIVGIVIRSNDRYSQVMSILHRDSKISAKIARLNAFGTLVWTSIGNPKLMELKYIPKHLNPKIDDIIQTSGASSYFPGGLPIGKIKEIEEDPQGGNFHSITVELFNDLSTTRYVNIINNLFKEDFKEIEEGEANE